MNVLKNQHLSQSSWPLGFGPLWSRLLAFLLVTGCLTPISGHDATFITKLFLISDRIDALFYPV